MHVTARVRGWVPRPDTNNRFDLAPQFRPVADQLSAYGIRVETCAGSTGSAALHGGDLSGIPFNGCVTDACIDTNDPFQRRIGTALYLMTAYRTYHGILQGVGLSFEFPERTIPVTVADVPTLLEVLRAMHGVQSLRVDYEYMSYPFLNGHFTV